jgi:glutathione S-transferase
MILYGAPNPAPNPRRVRIFLAEKGIDLPETLVDMRKREHKSAEFRAKNPAGQLPTLELDDGTTISETVAICRYFEETHPTPPLFGTTPVEMALVDQWVRRAEFIMMNPVGMFWRHAHPYTAALLTQFKDFGESNREAVMGSMRWFDRELDGKAFLTGDTYTMADICLLTTIDFGHWIGLELPGDVPHLKAWHDRVSARPSAGA